MRMKSGALKLATAAYVLICRIGTGLSAVGSLVRVFLPYLVKGAAGLRPLTGVW